jgi:indole-3-glycerol phosphate synthase
MDFLQTILEDKRVEVEVAKRRKPLGVMRQQSAETKGIRDFKGALQRQGMALIAEIKKSSPSKGTLTEKFDHLDLALQYQSGGADALSVLTDKKHFGGDKLFVQDVKDITRLPILRKDFLIDEYQVYESRVLGADAVLLIVKALSKDQLRELYECAMNTGLAALVETHSADDIEMANEIKADIIGINNRDLSTFEVTLQHSLDLRELVHADALCVSESGIVSADEVQQLQKAGFKAVLVGEGLLRQADRSAAVRTLIPRQ